MCVVRQIRLFVGNRPRSHVLTADFDRSLQLEQHRLRHEDLRRPVAQRPYHRFVQLHHLQGLALPHWKRPSGNRRSEGRVLTFEELPEDVVDVEGVHGSVRSRTFSLLGVYTSLSGFFYFYLLIRGRLVMSETRTLIAGSRLDCGFSWCAPKCVRWAALWRAASGVCLFAFHVDYDARKGMMDV